MDSVRALGTQVGGDHYTKLKIQPMEYSMANGLDACQHTIIKYVTRFRDKGGISDLEKAKHCIDLLIEFEKERLGEKSIEAKIDELIRGEPAAMTWVCTRASCKCGEEGFDPHGCLDYKPVPNPYVVHDPYQGAL